MPAHDHNIDLFQHSYVNSAPGSTQALTYDFASTPNSPNQAKAKTNGGGGATRTFSRRSLCRTSSSWTVNMRLELSGSLVHPDPLVIRFDSNQIFDILHYTDLGYTHFEVICIGGGGGMGGGIDTANTGTLVRSYGGAGGGGGYHRVRGLLSALPVTCPIVVGAGGAVGTEHASNPALTTDGGDGGSFDI